MKRSYLKSLIFTLLLIPALTAFGQRRYNPPIMNLDVGHFNLTFNKLTGDGGLQSMYSWNLTGAHPERTELFYWPADQWQSNMLYQIFNPISLDENGILNEKGVKQGAFVSGGALTNNGTTDWALETRRYRPPHIVVDGLTQDPPYLWSVDPNLKSDIKIEFEDVLAQFGIRSHVEVYGFSNPDHADYFIWKATHKFTGELKIPRQTASSLDSIPDQTIRFWWPISFSFGPTKAGERNALGGFSYEGEDDYDSWFKIPSKFGGARDSLYIAYYRDGKASGTISYSNGSTDDTGDPDRVTGHLYSTQIPGFTLLHADKSNNDNSDDKNQPYSMAHASIETNLWGDHSNGVRLVYRGDDANGHFPVDPPLTGTGGYQKGPMRFITVGPYSLTKDKKIGRADSITFVYAVGAGDIGWSKADSIGKLWLNKQINDQQRLDYMLKGRDSLAKALDHANWAWGRLSQGKSIPATPPPPDMTITSGFDKITVSWSYPDPSYFNDAVTKVDDWYAWRVYRKRGALMTDDPLDQKSGTRWELIYETKDRNQTTYVDKDVQRGIDYYYAVTALDNGTQNPDDIIPNQKLESSRFSTRSMVPAVPYKAGMDNADFVRVVPNPASRYAQGGALGSGTPDKISFFNLPYKCTLKIFTETGDLVKSIDHLGTADDSWDQRTDENQYVSTGIYILAVTNVQDVNGKGSENQFVKFIIVR